ncbi:hypothetical protein SDC9_17440 [bioreactor metagenome]|uniref:Uncharacterized protein n=1 Tax=bioreactor metagenome TaxID=1076179 RepID=A0A644TXG8_9ZZZZ
MGVDTRNYLTANKPTLMPYTKLNSDAYLLPAVLVLSNGFYLSVDTGAMHGKAV